MTGPTDRPAEKKSMDKNKCLMTKKYNRIPKSNG